MAAEKKRPTEAIYQMKVTLKNIQPPIWRRFQVPGRISLKKLHRIIQTLMPWDGYHLHQFIIDGVDYGEPDPEGDLSELKDDRYARLNKVVPAAPDRFIYEYDFGDGWEHEILVEKVLPPEEGVRYPICLAGKRACPPEDCAVSLDTPVFWKQFGTQSMKTTRASCNGSAGASIRKPLVRTISTTG